ncbi:MAG: SDR family NAD(P)-dependent oxidoreductase [Paludibacterium sp.]|uniref:SDR family NAD(P)-dependent oxidoreductase n=1 Tax=Paludibacterium sp. TaxID=1917523 RepID=UPI0025EC410B|nr:SDR family NAD(P)-dependent oxidoreductase [Paludibacterium sp.]MBV8046304.1 SDR family NAD(P)-dependent oxidoreductase [Paludibacterium sp.]MBV8649736.1 SDR family NAD(P)-dependent oxidoreductase [Paludibacterium sp.]
MARVFITGSSDGLGRLAGELLLSQGHEVVWHARNAARADEMAERLPAGAAVTIGDLSSLAQMRAVAEQVNRMGVFDAVIHNVGVGYLEPRRVETADGWPLLFAVNVMAPYVLTALIDRPKRLVYLSSGMHLGVSAHLDDTLWTRRRWEGAEAYAESKLHDALLAFAIARHWPAVQANAVDPGWVPTRMGGLSAPDDLDLGCRTQAWLAVSDEAAACVSGKYFYHLQQQDANPEARRSDLQDRLIALCAHYCGIALPD